MISNWLVGWLVLMILAMDSEAEWPRTWTGDGAEGCEAGFDQDEGDGCGLYRLVSRNSISPITPHPLSLLWTHQAAERLGFKLTSSYAHLCPLVSLFFLFSCLDDEELGFLGAPWDEYSVAAAELGLDILRYVRLLFLSSFTSTCIYICLYI